MLRKLFSIIGFSCFFVTAQDTLRTHIILDSLENEVFLIVDKHQQPIKYFSSVFTPVCVDGSCYPINIELQWDLAGNYLKYSLRKDEILTKVEHLPFTDFDYGLLHRMIAKSPSALANFTIYELTLPDENKVDGVTGATRPELSGSFVPEALFTTYTLWHLARRPKADLLAYTRERYFKLEWADFIMQNSVLECKEAFVKQLLSGKSKKEQDQLIFEMIRQYHMNFPLVLLNSVDRNAFTAQQLIELYQQTDNNDLKSVILSRWNHLGIEEKELVAITLEIGFCSSCFNDELALIQAYEQWPEMEYALFYSKIQKQRNMMRRQKMLQVLEEREDSYPKSFKKIIKRSS